MTAGRPGSASASSSRVGSFEALRREGGDPRCSPALLLQAASIVDRLLPDRLSEDGPASLYAGPLGAALFRASLARVAPAGAARLEHRRRSLAALAPLRRRLADAADGAAAGEAEEREGLGGFHGAGAAVYALTCIGQLLDAPELLDEAVGAARRITRERVARDRDLDVVSGSAGALLALVALEEALGERGETAPLAELRNRADACARRLLACRLEPPGGGPRGWGVAGHPSGRLQSGFAHGAAGIAYALLALFRRSGERELLDAALEGMELERSLYRPELGKWLPFWAPSEEGLHLMSAWCRGGPGIALGRIACLEALGADPGAGLEPLVRDFRDGLRATLEQPQTLEDHLCCGNLGRAEVLVRAFAASAGSPAERPPSLLEAADRLVYGVLGQARARGGFGGSTEVPDADPDPSFMKGAAGVGFAFLRLARPDFLPFPLLLEPVPSPGVPIPSREAPQG